MTFDGDAVAPDCPDCMSNSTKRIDADYLSDDTPDTTVYRCLDCDTEYSRPDGQL
jgi:DNA-directed RNA polymerase subunit M/transcription elongation factor TFIIS